MSTMFPLEEIATVSGSSINPALQGDELFDLYSLPAYDAGAPETVPGGEIKSSKTLVSAGHVLLSKLNPRIPRVWLVDQARAHRQIASTEFIPFCIRDRSRVDAEYLALMLAAPQFIGELAKQVRSSTGSHQRVRPADVVKRCIPVPDRLDDQRGIVSRINACMERVKAIEALRAEAVQEAAAITPSLLNEVFVDVASRATSKSIEEVTLETRYGTSQKCHAEPSGVPILRIPNVAAGSVNFDHLKYCALSDEELQRIQLVAGDLLFVRTNGSRDLVGRCAVFECRLAEEPVGFASYLIRVRLDPQQVLSRYLAYFLNSTKGREEINQRRRTSAGQFNINSENLRSISLPVPSVQEQARLIAVMEERDQLASQLTGELRTAGPEHAQLRASILRAAFAGEL